MPTFDLSPEGSPRVGITAEDLAWLAANMIGKLWPKRSDDVHYDIGTAANAYGDQPWVTLSCSKGFLELPYIIVHKYPLTSAVGDWGSAMMSGHFTFPPQLREHRHAMVTRFTREGRLKPEKGDSLCPRVVGFSLDPNGRPRLQVERARYYDQVGTNLTIDYPLKTPIEVAGVRRETVREWDRAQACGNQQALPTFERSRLANTIGVSIAVTCMSANGVVLLQRHRQQGVAIHQDIWFTPFAFALSLNDAIADGPHDLSLIIAQDYGHEFAEELNLELDTFTAPRPVALCRDLVRGGKPQFFFEITSRLSYEEITKRIGKKGPEDPSAARAVKANDIENDNVLVSPELLCQLALLQERGSGSIGI